VIARRTTKIATPDAVNSRRVERRKITAYFSL
jgi:hypothetical protein